MSDKLHHSLLLRRLTRVPRQISSCFLDRIIFFPSACYSLCYHCFQRSSQLNCIYLCVLTTKSFEMRSLVSHTRVGIFVSFESPFRVFRNQNETSSSPQIIFTSFVVTVTSVPREIPINPFSRNSLRNHHNILNLRLKHNLKLRFLVL